jgi:hypothetical protein
MNQDQPNILLIESAPLILITMVDEKQEPKGSIRRSVSSSPEEDLFFAWNRMTFARLTLIT